ncbi:hypothetical protein F4778DRAFT_343245 [Xylariomycetidae sp. FL2044]|nr:hypothetical protein F4778DRAFT_343245 [Xylariomycetidae sp. FL2044]
MSLFPPVVMSSALHYEAPNGRAPHSGVHSGLFRPPMSPTSASSSLYLTKSTGSLSSDSTPAGMNVKRKRPGLQASTPFSGWVATTSREAEDSPAINQQTKGRTGRYVLAGHIGTPSGAAQRQLGDMDDSMHSDVDYRRALGSKCPLQDFESPYPQRSDMEPRLTAQPGQPGGWGSFAFSTLGGVVGKVWEFCKAGAFRGFYAGGGRGYEMQPGSGSTQSSDPTSRAWYNEDDIISSGEYDFTSFPGGFPESDYSPFLYERETPDSTPPPAAKRRQIQDGAPGDELRRNWVMVNDPTDHKKQTTVSSRAYNVHQAQRPTPPPLARRISKPVSRLNPPILNRHQSNSRRISHAGSASLSSREPASFASSRSPVTSHAPSRLPVPSRPQSSSPFSPTRPIHRPSRIPSPSPQPKHHSHRRTHSAASAAVTGVPHSPAHRVRKRNSTQGIHDSSPRLDAEAKNLAVKRMQEEMETDLRINDFNARLRDMIRQGKEALGTTVEVEVDGEDGDQDIWDDD